MKIITIRISIIENKGVTRPQNTRQSDIRPYYTNRPHIEHPYNAVDAVLNDSLNALLNPLLPFSEDNQTTKAQ